MSTDRTRPISDFDRLASAWLGEGPTELNDEVLEAALLEARSTPQRRPFAPWRSFRMSISTPAGLARVAASAAAIALVAGGSFLLLRQPSVGPGASPSVTPSPSPTGIPIGVGLTQPFISPLYGYTVQVPIAWQATPATSAWHPTDGTADLDSPTADVFQIGPAADGIRAEIVAEAAPTLTTSASWSAQWEIFREVGGHCLGHASPWVDATVAGIAARTFSWHCGDADPVEHAGDYDEYTFFVGGEGFVIHGIPSMVRQLVASFGPPPTALPANPAGLGEIAFVSDRADRNVNQDIYVMEADGSNVRRLTTDPAQDVNPAWSRDHSKLVFVRGDTLADVWVMDADGGNQRQVTHSTMAARRPTFSADGTRVAFVDADKGWLYVVNVDGSGLHAIDKPTTGLDRDPAWSPDGSVIAFVNDGSVFTVKPDGTGLVLVVHRFLSSPPIGMPTWKPSGGNTIAMVKDGAIWSEDWGSNGSQGGSNLTADSNFRSAGWPSWSIDGSWIAFDGESPPNGNEIYVMQADGTNVINLTNDPATDTQPAWS